MAFKVTVGTNWTRLLDADAAIPSGPVVTTEPDVPAAAVRITAHAGDIDVLVGAIHRASRPAVLEAGESVVFQARTAAMGAGPIRTVLVRARTGSATVSVRPEAA
ncbi:MAG: hypothetical protein IOD15_00280 [Phycisphaerales bacterium]|nr:hypothetical protein [Phycisphaerales bacterium]